jgi:hypothetical protein
VRQVTRFEQEVFQRTEEFSIKMGDIIHKMGKQMPEAFFGLNIFLATYMAKPAFYNGSAV